MAVNQASLAKLMQSVEAGRSEVAALCFLVWDLIITMDQEVEHIWLTPFQPLKILYLLTRYYSLVPLIAINARSLSCQAWIGFEAVSALLLEISVEIILILRIYAMYAANRSLLRVLIPCFVAQILLMLGSLAVSLPRVMSSPGCISTMFPAEIIVYTISSILFESVLFGLTVYKYFGARKEGWGRQSLLNLLVRDSVWTFALVLIAMIANTLFFTLAPATLAALGFPWLLAILGALGPRLILNVRAEHARTRTQYFADSMPVSFSLSTSASPTSSPSALFYTPVSTLESAATSCASVDDGTDACADAVSGSEESPVSKGGLDVEKLSLSRPSRQLSPSARLLSPGSDHSGHSSPGGRSSPGRSSPGRRSPRPLPRPPSRPPA